SAAATDTIDADVVAPSISGATAANLRVDSATITWTTDEPATSQVEYGPGTAFTSATPIDNSLVIAHTVVVPGLASRTGYVYRVRSRDAAANEAISATNTFTTPTPPDTAPPSVPDGVSATATSLTTTSYFDSRLSPSTPYSYTVAAFDAAGNRSAQSSAGATSTLPDKTLPSVV